MCLLQIRNGCADPEQEPGTAAVIGSRA